MKLAHPQRNLAKAMQDGAFLCSIQIDPPRSADMQKLIRVVTRLKRAGTRIVDINSSRINATGRPSHDSIYLAGALAARGLETIPHITMRDSSLSGILNGVLAAYAWHGVRNILLITGDPHEKAQQIVPRRGIFQSDVIDAIGIIHRELRAKEPFNTDLAIGVALNQNTDLRTETPRLRRKISVGADFVMSQPVFDESQLDRLLTIYHRHCHPAKPIMVGIWPLVSQKTIAQIYHEEFDGVVLPKSAMVETRSFGEDEKTLASWGLHRAEALIRRAKTKGAGGVYLVAPFKNPLLVLPLLRSLSDILT